MKIFSLLALTLRLKRCSITVTLKALINRKGEAMGITLRAARVNRGLTQAEAAELMGVKPRTIVNWENGSSLPNVAAVNKIIEVYGIPFDDLNFCPEITPKAKIR